MSIISALIGPVTGLLDQFIEDKDQKARLAHELSTMADQHAQSIALAQIEVNKADAKGNWFQSGWRPFIGWACGFALAYTYVMQPILTFGLAQAGYLIDLPAVNLGEMMPVLMGLLGLGGLRSWEKVKGVSR